MNTCNIESVTDALEKTRVSPSGVSFAGKSLKLNTEEDAKEVIEEINNCPNLQYLNLEGNTLGVDASKGIADALKKHPEFKRALWKDMFTGRMKSEIPKALQYLGNGLVAAGTRLTELDLSDNAFGPIGVEGLASLLRSPTCYALEELRLNNNGLGITGGKLLASALTECYKSSQKEGKPLALKVFIAGRNRLENDGAKALAQVFKMIGTLEEIAMPQNGIYHLGISALSEAFTHNENLLVLNLNDNTLGIKGIEAIANALPKLQNLREINFGDCLLKTKGALRLARALESAHTNLEDVTLGFNEIKTKGALQLVGAMKNKSKLKNLTLDGNTFGEGGKEEVRKKLKEIGKLQVLGSLDDNESEDSDDNDSHNSGESEGENESELSEKESETNEIHSEVSDSISVDDFLAKPSADTFMALGNDRTELILKYAKKTGPASTENYVSTLMKVSSLTISSGRPDVAETALKCTEILYKELFIWAQQADRVSLVNNILLVHLGLIKSEKKNVPPVWDMEACLNALKNIVSKNYIPESTKNTLTVFMQREIDNNASYLTMKNQILSSLI